MGEIRLNKSKIYEWLGFLIVIASIWADGMIRSKGNSHTIWLYVTVSGMVIGTTITFVAYFIRKRQDSSKKE